MNTRADIHRELFGRLAAAERLSPFRPSLDAAAVNELCRDAGHCATAMAQDSPHSIRMYAMDAAVAALRIVYSLDDALS